MDIFIDILIVTVQTPLIFIVFLYASRQIINSKYSPPEL